MKQALIFQPFSPPSPSPSSSSSSSKSGNNNDSEWGTDEFILASVLLDESLGFCVGGKIKIGVEIELFGEVNINSQPLAKLIENSSEMEDLIAMADNELGLIIKKLPVGKQTAGTLSLQQDELLHSRFANSAAAAAAAASKRGKSRKESTRGGF